jgi:hypothetical protein
MTRQHCASQTRVWRCAYGVFVADLSGKFYTTERYQPEGNVVTNILRTDTNSATSNDHDVLCGLETLLPLRHELTNVSVAFWVVDGTSPLGSSRQYKDCGTRRR